MSFVCHFCSHVVCISSSIVKNLFATLFLCHLISLLSFLVALFCVVIFLTRRLLFATTSLYYIISLSHYFSVTFFICHITSLSQYFSVALTLCHIISLSHRFSIVPPIVFFSRLHLPGVCNSRSEEFLSFTVQRSALSSFAIRQEKLICRTPVGAGSISGSPAFALDSIVCD